MDAPYPGRLSEPDVAKPAAKPARSSASQNLRDLVILGAPSLGLSLAITMLSAYLPLLLRKMVHAESIVGLIVSGEGLFALVVPVVLGALSDRLRTPIGPRLPFLLAATPVAAAALAVLPYSSSLALLVVAVATFYFAYFAYYSPYRAMFADLIHPDFAGRAQSSQMIFREIGLGGALMGGGLLMQLWQPLPFLLSACVLAVVTAVVYAGFRARYRGWADRSDRIGGSVSAPQPEPALREVVRRLADLLVRHRDIRSLLVANALWEFALGGLKTFVILYIVAGIGHSVGTASLLMGLVAATAVVSAPIAGTLADRYGIARVMRFALVVYGTGLFLPLLSHSLRVIVPVLPIVGLGGGLAMSLPYGLLMRLMPRREHGAAAGLFEFSRGLGTTLGPLVTGAVIDWSQKPLQSTHGYAAMWPVAGLAILLSVPFIPDDRAPGRMAK